MSRLIGKELIENLEELRAEFVNLVEAENPRITKRFHVVILMLSVPYYKFLKLKSDFCHDFTYVNMEGKKVGFFPNIHYNTAASFVRFKNTIYFRINFFKTL